eukprot:5312016-Pyramimonas_sp.AAC.2
MLSSYDILSAPVIDYAGNNAFLGFVDVADVVRSFIGPSGVPAGFWGGLRTAIAYRSQEDIKWQDKSHFIFY